MTGGESGPGGQHHHRVQAGQAGPGQGQRLDRPHQDAPHHTGGQSSPVKTVTIILSLCINHAETELSDGVPAHPDKPQPQHGVRGESGHTHLGFVCYPGHFRSGYFAQISLECPRQQTQSGRRPKILDVSL